MFGGQEIKRGDQSSLRIILDVELGLHRLIDVRNCSRLTPRAPAIAADKIESNGTHGCVKETAVANVVMPSPKFDERFLNNIFRVSRRARPLPGEKHEAGREFRKASLPIFIGGDILHDLFTVFYNRDAAKSCFCLRSRRFFLASSEAACDNRPMNLMAMNWLAVICAAAAYWIIGAIWYVALFGKTWAAAIEQTGVKIQRGGMGAKMVGNFLCNLVAAAIMARLIARTGITELGYGLKLGAGVGLGFSATALTVQYLWESKPFKVWLIDCSYHFVGCIAIGGILAVWH